MIPSFSVASPSIFQLVGFVDSSVLFSIAAMPSGPSTVLMFQVKAIKSRQWLSAPNIAAAPPASLRASAEAKAESQLVARSVGVVMVFPALSLIFIFSSIRS